MICPNGNITVNSLLSKVTSGDYEVWYEPNDKPEDWDWRKQGFYRSPNRKKITDKESLLDAISKEYAQEGKIIYDATREYYSKHPYAGEAKSYVKEAFYWEYSSCFGERRCYKICESTYLGEGPSPVPLELVCYEGDFNSVCFTVGYWDKTDEGYEFTSCGSRLFDYVSEEDLPEIWKAVKAADKFLNKRFEEEK